MVSSIATFVFALGILVLFVLDRDQKARTSTALLVPTVWLLIVGSRPVSLWLQMASPIDSPEQYLEGSPLDGTVFVVLLAVGLIVLASRGRRIGPLLRGTGPLLAFLLYCAVSILWSDYSGVAFKRWIKFVGDFVMVLIVLTDTNPSAAVKRLLAWTGFLLVPLSIFLIEFYPDLGRVYGPRIVTPMVAGVTTGKNNLGMICMIFGLASLWRILQEFRGEGRCRVGPLIAHGTLLAMVLWLFAKANSVTPFGSFVLAASLMAVLSTTSLARRPAIVHLLVAAVLSVSLAATFLDAGTALEALGRDPTLTGRTALWKRTLTMTANPLLGTGFESFWLGERLEMMWSIYWWHPNQAHDGYLEIFLNLGWIGIALFAVVLVTGYRNAVSEFRRNQQTGSLKLAYLIAMAIYNLTEAAFKMTNPVWIAFVLAATAAADARGGGGADIPSRVQVRPEQVARELPANRQSTYEEIV